MTTGNTAYIVCRQALGRLECPARGFTKLAARYAAISSVEQLSRRKNILLPFDNCNGSNSHDGQKYQSLKIAAGFAFASASIYAWKKYHDDINEYCKSKFSVSAARKKKEPHASEKPALTSRELRFLNFASVEYEGQIFMTPRDFLDSVTLGQAKARQQRRQLNDDDVKQMLKKIPPFSKGSKDLFRQMDENGLISFTEFLFLLCVLTKPTSGFRIAFNMFDTDGNQRVDKKEFLVIQALTLMFRAGGKIAELDSYLDSVPHQMLKLVSDTPLQIRKEYQNQLEKDATHYSLETVFASSRRQKRELQLRQYQKSVGSADASEGSGDKEPGSTGSQAVQETSSRASMTPDSQLSMWEKTERIMETMRVQDTTLLVHFFGSKGDKTLAYQDFHRFMENLQTEVLEIEFMEFSQGKPTITETDFATILLRYTVAKPDDYKAYMERVKTRIPDEKGITFEQFRQFCQFLTYLDDFTIAVKLYTFADLPVSQAEFARAVKVSTGHALDPHVVDTVFQIFDVNNDGRLSYTEFIAVMRERLHRGFKTKLVEKQGWDAFKQCIRAEMKRY